MAHAAERGWAGCRRWLGAASGVSCQIRIASIVYFPLVPLIKSRGTPNKGGLWPEVDGWVGVSTKWYLSSVASGYILVAWIWA